jgi:pimeloyl-ACP methyl ester carboxylesterase
VTRRGTIVYLHGVADNRASAAGVIPRLLARGFDVVAYDSRAHGNSEGDFCTYGYFEKDDLHKVLDTVSPGPIVLIGTSLGAAVALQEAADDPRVTAIVAAETFSDLRTVATERAPWFFTSRVINRAFALAEEQAHFRVDAVSPERAATQISVPVLLLHGALDHDTPPAHSQRVLAALKNPKKRLALISDAHHNESLNARTWVEIERWIDIVIARAAGGNRLAAFATFPPDGFRCPGAGGPHLLISFPPVCGA